MELSPNQKIAASKLKTGNVLVGGVGSGKTRTALTWYFENVCGGKVMGENKDEYRKMTNPKNLYVITTARKRDTLDWEDEAAPLILEHSGVTMTVDSWNLISNYTSIKNSVFIFDEQRVVGSGVWVKSFLKIAKNNDWILLSATPGDRWLDYIPLFIANGFYKNRSEFIENHVIYSSFVKFPKVERYIGVSKLIKLRDQILVDMPFVRNTKSHSNNIICTFDEHLQRRIFVDRWNIYEDEPIRDVSEMCRLLRRLVNTDPSRLSALTKIYNEHYKVIVFYNFDYEWYMLQEFCKDNDIPYSSWNGHVHQEIPSGDTWIYMVQYLAGAEAWNCIETNAMVFFSKNYSYKQTAQAAGRIDRRNTPFTNLYYYYLTSHSIIDRAISKAFSKKETFNENRFIKF